MVDVVLIQRIDPRFNARAIVAVTTDSSSDAAIVAPRLLRAIASPIARREVPSPPLFREDRAE